MNQTTQPVLSDEHSDQMFKDRKVRRAIVRESHLLFFHFYFPHYVRYETAPMHFELFRMSEDETISRLIVVAFRGSSKSTLMTMSYPLWAILGKQRKKFVLILCQTRAQAKQHMMNLKRELEGNDLLNNDLGPFQTENDEWGSASLVFSRLNARITAASTEQSIRGLRHHQHRPDVIVGDDLEDVPSTRTHEARQKTFDWLMGEVLPAGDRQTRLILVGNYLHEDALLMRLRHKIEEQTMKGVFRAYPLVRDDGIINWPGMYPDMVSIEELRKEKGDVAFEREYQLKTISTEEQIVKREWIQQYDRNAPPTFPDYRGIIVGVDLASSQRDGADFTAMVAAKVYGYGSKMKIIILPYVVNEKLSGLETVKKIEELHERWKLEGPVLFGIESVAYQRVLLDFLEETDVSAEPITPGGQDKAAWLQAYATKIQSGAVYFPNKGAELLLIQVIGFGSERHDDQVDALTIMMRRIDMLKKHPPVHFKQKGSIREAMYGRGEIVLEDSNDDPSMRYLRRMYRERHG